MKSLPHVKNWWDIVCNILEMIQECKIQNPLRGIFSTPSRSIYLLETMKISARDEESFTKLKTRISQITLTLFMSNEKILVLSTLSSTWF